MSQTIFNVPVAETGINYSTSTGLITLTVDDLADIIKSQDDPAIVCPRIKLGHDDPRFDHETADGEPAFGLVQNLRVENNGNTLVADLAEMPDWLATVAPASYPNRSIEGNWDVETVTGHKYRFVMTDLALLGVRWPGISTLADLIAAVSDEGPGGVTVTAKTAAQKFAEFVKASTNLEDVRRAFYSDVAVGNQQWWWVRAILLEPNELIVDDDMDGLFRVPFDATGDSVVFSDPIPVEIQYVDQKVAAAAKQETVLAAFSSGQASRPADRIKPTQEDQVTDVDLSLTPVQATLLRRILGLANDATEEQVAAALAEKEAAPEVPEITTVPVTSEEVITPVTEPAEQVAASPGMVSIDAGTLAALQHNSNLGVAAFEHNRVTSRDSFLSAAVMAGKFPPARLQHWAAAWDSEYKNLGNSDGIKAAIDAMPAGLLPVRQMSVAATAEGTSTEAYPKGWLPEVHRPSVAKITQEA